jgi:2-methylcitrate dehydratase PrpD
MDITKALAGYIVRLNFSDLPEDVVERAKLCFLDWMGVTLAAVDEPLADILVQVAEIQGGNPQASVIGRRLRTSVQQAALINGSVSHALDFDDGQRKMIGHPSVPVFPAILALGEWKRSTGKDFITAFIAGCEAECRVAYIVCPDHYRWGWHATGTLGHFGAAAGCANLLRLNPSQAVHAIGIAGTQAAGLQQVFGTMCKPFHAGKAAMNGLLSALLAEKGFTSSPDMLEGEKGFSKVFSHRPEPARVLEGLGQNYAIREVYFKRHASCAATHSAMDAVIALKEECGLTLEQIDSIHLTTIAQHFSEAGKAAPQTGLEGKFSLSFCIALALVDGDTSPQSFNDQKVRDPRIIAIRDKVRIEIDDAILPEVLAKIKIFTREGKVLEKSMHSLKPIQDRERLGRELTEKFRSLSNPVLGQQKTEKLIGAIKNLEEIQDLSILSRSFSP